MKIITTISIVIIAISIIRYSAVIVPQGDVWVHNCTLSVGILNGEEDDYVLITLRMI